MMFNAKKLLVFFSLVGALFAENSETLNLYGTFGLGFGTGGELFSSSYQNSSGEITKETNKYFNYGQGLKFDLGAQYYLMPNVALQSGIEFSGRIPGFKTEDFQATASGTDTTLTTTFHTGLFGIKALIVPRFEILELTTMYVGAGAGLFWNSLKYESVKETVSSKLTENGKIRSNPKIGLLGLVGVDYPVSDLICAFGEVAFEQMSFTWSKKQIERSDFNRPGVIRYEKNAPNQEAPPRIPGSNWQIRFGIRYAIL
ncbi:MAG: hypothetical protein GX640_01800 [Fibrobacter sp.]|nr:hypothetical protein [Fibrobacter sp.]